jgi:antitoxin (DNA-binding transcriptional repressor) of toxin-antitoxin stability system
MEQLATKSVSDIYAKEHFDELLRDVEAGHTVDILKGGRIIARFAPAETPKIDPEKVQAAIDALSRLPRAPLPEGMTIRDLIEEGRRY